MRKTTLFLLLGSLIVILLFSGCLATITASRYDTSKIINKIENEWPEEYKQYAKDNDLYPKEHKPNYSLLYASDALFYASIAEIVITAAMYDSNISDIEAWLTYASLMYLDIYLIANAWFYLTSPPEFDFEKLTEMVRKGVEEEKRKAEEQKRYEKELELAKERFASNPNLCPLEIIDLGLSSNKSKIIITVKNISPWPIKAFEVKIEGQNVFGDKVYLGALKDYMLGISEAYIDPLEIYAASWVNPEETTYSVAAKITRVLYQNGREWHLNENQ